MLKVMEKNKKYLFGMIIVGLFGIVGLLLMPTVMYIIKVSNRYPNLFRWIFVTTFVLIGIYEFLFAREWDTGVVLICIGGVIAVSSCLNTKGR